MSNGTSISDCQDVATARTRRCLKRFP